MNESVSKRPTVRLRGKTFFIEMTRYSDNENTCIVLLNEEGGVEYKVTANLEPLKPQFCYIKDYSENKGMSVAMKKYLTPTGQYKPSGHVRFHQYAISNVLLEMAGIEPRNVTPVEPPIPSQVYEPVEPADAPDSEDVPDVSFEDAERGAEAFEEGSAHAVLDEDIIDTANEVADAMAEATEDDMPADATAGVPDDEPPPSAAA